MARKLFWEDPYQAECTARVTSIDGNTVKLDQTIFFAFSGGQESDHGTISGIEVVNAVKEGDKENIIDIAYELATSPLFKVGENVRVIINSERRQRLMKLHSAVHIVYYMLEAKVGTYTTIGSHIAEHKARLDILYPAPISDLLAGVQDAVNSFLAHGHEILRERDLKNPDMWWWKCGEWKMPCGGTHPRSTTEIGTIQLKRKNIGSGKERIEVMLVG